MRSPIVRLLVFWLCCLHLCGGSRGLLQAAAWTSMAAQYTAASGLETGLRETFDGKHPCKLCQALRASIQSEQEGQAPAPENSKKPAGKEKAPSGAELWDALPRHLAIASQSLTVVALAAAAALRPTGWDGAAPEGPPPRVG